MLNFETYIDLPLVWSCILAFAIFLYVLLDGFDLGIGILFPFAPSDSCRNKMIDSIAPFWDGNETWLVLGGGGLFAVFPLAFATLMPALYVPIILMLMALVLRGVAFEFRFKVHTSLGRKIWDGAFHYGSLFAAFCQGIILGTFVQGVKVVDNKFAGGILDWLTPFALMTGMALVCGYILLGANWLIYRTTDATQKWARKSSAYIAIYVLFFMGMVSLWTPFMNEMVYNRWFSYPNILYLAPVPALSMTLFIWHQYSVVRGGELLPFVLSICLFGLNFLGLGISIWPFVVPYEIDIWQAAAAPESQTFILIGAAFLLPLILSYTAYSYYVFRGKVREEEFYH
ncbi:MAG: cytochrome d ubiquinol oxidase subunit II [Proteobacteria bacterium]|nr:cytochrome d ubiquinol oxidase subunit II [Pseudomonadota bacterium]